MTEQAPFKREAEVRDPVLLGASRIVAPLGPDAVLAVVACVIVGFGGGFISWNRYRGITVEASAFLSVIGLFAICLGLVRAARWALKEGREVKVPPQSGPEA